MRARRPLLLVAAALGSLLPARLLVAADAPAAPARSEVRIHPIGALVRAHPWFLTDRGPFPADPTDVNSLAAPLYGGETEEGSRPVGIAQEVVSALRAATGTPDAWDAEGTALWAESGSDLLFVQAPAPLQAEVAAQLEAWAREASTTQVVDVAVLEGDPETARGPGALAAAVASGSLVPLAVARILPSTQGTGSVRDGGRWAFLQDYDVEVACECNVPDPIVGVAPEGLAARAVALPTAKGRWTVHLQGWWASPPTLTPRRIQGGRTFGQIHKGPTVPPPPGGDVFEAVTSRGESFRVPLTLTEDVWEAVPLSGRTALAVRIHVDRPPLTGGSGTGLPASLAGEGYGPTAPLPPAGPLAVHAFEVGDLGRLVECGRGLAPILAPSNYAPPGSPDVAEPWPAVGSDSLRRLLEGAVAPLADEGLLVDGVRGRLTVRTDAARADAVARILGDLRSRRLRTTRVVATVVTLPLASLPEAWGEPEALASVGLPGLLQRPGARVTDRASVDLREGQRLASVAGTQRAYVRDYDVEIACTTTIGNPVVGAVFSGLSLDVQADPVLSSPLVSLLVRVDRSVLREMRVLRTRYGEIEAPVTRDQNLRGAVVLAPGETRVVGLSAWGGEATLVLLSRPAAP